MRSLYRVVRWFRKRLFLIVVFGVAKFHVEVRFAALRFDLVNSEVDITVGVVPLMGAGVSVSRVTVTLSLMRYRPCQRWTFFRDHASSCL